MMGDKTRARELMAKAGVPFPPGTESAIEDPVAAKKVASEIGYPVLIKAAAGGGGKGMRIVHSEKDFEKSVKAARSEAKSSFGDDRVFVEKYLEDPAISNSRFLLISMEMLFICLKGSVPFSAAIKK
jgi:acetyl-CoA carboxylase, biotin carboxylase subunit